MKVLKRNPLLNTSHLETLSEKPDMLLNQLRVNEGVNLFVENANVPHPTGLNIGESEKEGLINTTGSIETPKWEIEHELDGLRFQVRFNTPIDSKNKEPIVPEHAITASQIQESQNEIYKHYMIVDRRISVLDLKIKLSAFLGVGLHEIVFRRGGSHGVELLEDDDSLKQAQFYNLICLYLEIGVPSVLGQKRINFYLAKNAQAFFQETNPEDGLVSVPDNCFFSFEELAQLPCKTATKVLVIKQQVIDFLAVKFPKLGLEKLDPSRIRLREKTGEDKLTSVLHESRELSRYQIYEGKEIALQILPELPPESPWEQDQCYLSIVKVWDPSDWTMSDLVEIYVPKNATLAQFGSILAAKFPHISLENIECTKINSSWNFSRVQLPYENWLCLQGSEEFVASAPFYVSTDGIFFVIRDKTVDGREMTPEEKALYRSDDFENKMMSAPVTKTRIGADGKPYRYTGPVEHGIKITVKSKAESDAMNASAATAQ